MECNKNVIVPELIIDECNGCFTSTQCVTLSEAIEELNLPQGTNLTDVIKQLVFEIAELKSRLPQ